MRIPEYKSLYPRACQRVSNAPFSPQIALIYAGVCVGTAAVISSLQFFLTSRIDQIGGLGNLGLRSLLASMSQFLPLLQTGILLIINFGYMAAMVRISRGLYTSPNTLRAGLDRFWPLLRCTLLKMIIYMGVMFASFYVAMGIFLISPFSNKLVGLVTPLVSESTVLSVESLAMDEATQTAIFRATIPALVIFAIVASAMCIPVFYRYRMVNYVLYDHPGINAMNALRQSKLMMRRNRLSLFRMDLHFWWYYLMLLGVILVAYADLILPLLGIPLPFGSDVAYFVFYFLSLALQFAVFYYFKNKVETVYAMVYNALSPKDESTGVVLGNIFQM